MKTLLLCISVLVISYSQKPNEIILNSFIKSFNDKNIDGMMKLVSDSVSYSYVIKNKIIVEAQSKNELKKSMASYFKSYSTVHSEVEDLIVTNTFISFIERVSWVSDGKKHNQKSLATYKFKNGLIHRAWYFSAEK